LGTVSKEFLQTPGPGSYEPTITKSADSGHGSATFDNSADLSKPHKDPRYYKSNLNPFGSSLPRFRYNHFTNGDDTSGIGPNEQRQNEQFTT
jgi:hypothetical protein